MATTIKMPQLGESVTEGTIERWLVKEGDTVEQYDPLFEVVTDKVNAEVPAEIAGTISKILVPDGETVAVGTPVAEIDADGAGAATPAAERPPPRRPPPRRPPPSPRPSPRRHRRRLSRRRQSRSPRRRRLPPMPARQPSRSRNREPASAEAAPAAAARRPSRPQQAAATGGRRGRRASPPAAGGGNGAARMTPAVRRLVREHDIDVAQLTGTGAGGRVTRDDVLSFIDRGPQAAAEPAQPAQAQAEVGRSCRATALAAEPEAAAARRGGSQRAEPPRLRHRSRFRPGGDTEVPLSQMRKAIARKMTQVKQTVPHAYTVVEVDMTSVVRWREANNMAFKAREGASLSYVAVVVKAVTETLRKHPNLNSQFADDKIILKQAMNIGIAVAVDNGLIVPVIHNADQLSISGVNARVRDISSRAKGGKLKLDELQGGTFTVNNTGWFGSVSSMPIINAPEVAILSMEAIVKRPRVMEVDGEDVIAIRHMMNMTCSFDHRVLDGAQVGFFLADVRKALEEWDANTPIG